MIMITWILLVSLFCKSTQDRNGKENAVLRCGPQNMTLTTPDKKILLTWEDEAACLAVRDALTYELAVLIADEQVHDDIVAVTPDQVGSTHSWSWTPDLALECASHSVRLRARYKNHTSPWRQEQTAPGIENKSKQPKIFPQDRVVKVGIRATFCCVLPEGHIFEQMYVTSYSGSEWNTTKITNQTYAMTVDLNQPSNTYGSGTDVLCRTQINDNGASVFIGYPPDDKDLQCETRDLQSVECTWAVGNNTHLGSKHQTVYRLLGSPCANPGSCFRKAQVSVGEQNWTLTAQNPLGTVELTHRADLMKRVHMIAPEGLTASDVNARNVTLKWRLTVPQYNNLDITCQVNNSGITTASETFGVGLTSTVLDDLIPDSTYTVMVRCGTTRHLWKWSEWSSSIKFQTKGDVPDALDVWMQAKDNETMIVWKVLLANQSHGHILDHEVTWAPTNTPERKNRSKVDHNKNGLVLSLDATREYIISVTARNINGSSSPSTITIPSSSPPNRVDPSRILGTDGGFNLSWSASPIASCGYIVDWCPTSVESTVDWLKVPPGETNASIFRNFKDGLRYLLSVYACTQGAPVLLERREGYVREKKIQDDLFGTLKWKQQDSDVEVSWDSLPPRAQTAFITGYILYCLDNNNNNVYSVSTDNPEATKLTARNLKIGTYIFKVMAKTAVGECGTTIIRATLNSPTDYLVKAIIMSLVTVFGLLFLITVLCYRHWACIKRKVYPPIPKPVLTDKWLTSPGELSCRPLRVDLCHHSEAHIMDVPELQYKLDEASEEKTQVFTQTPKGYYNQTLKKDTPSPFISPSTIPSFRSIFPNPSYDLMIKTGDQQSNSGPGSHEWTPLERCSSGYQAQSPINHPEEDSDSPLYCVSAYILLPNEPSK